MRTRYARDAIQNGTKYFVFARDAITMLVFCGMAPNWQVPNGGVGTWALEKGAKNPYRHVPHGADYLIFVKTRFAHL